MSADEAETVAPLILVVDDEEPNRDMLSRRLEKKGYRVELAADGFEALNRVEQRAYDLVILDIMMPRLSGLEVLHTLRKERDDLQLPVVMASAKTQIDDIVSAMKLGANDYITKPIELPIVLAVIERVFRQRERLRGAVRSARALEARIDASPDALSAHTAQGTFTWVSAAIERQLGHSVASLVGSSLFALMHPEDLRHDAVASPDRPGEHVAVVRLRHADGSWRWTELVTRREPSGDGEVLVAYRDLGRWVGASGKPELGARVR